MKHCFIQFLIRLSVKELYIRCWGWWAKYSFDCLCCKPIRNVQVDVDRENDSTVNDRDRADTADDRRTSATFACMVIGWLDRQHRYGI